MPNKAIFVPGLAVLIAIVVTLIGGPGAIGLGPDGPHTAYAQVEKCSDTVSSGDCLALRTIHRPPPTGCWFTQSRHIYFDIWACAEGECVLDQHSIVTIRAYHGDPAGSGTLLGTIYVSPNDPASDPLTNGYDHFEWEICFGPVSVAPDYFQIAIGGGCGTEYVTVTSCCENTGCDE